MLPILMQYTSGPYINSASTACHNVVLWHGAAQAVGDGTGVKPIYESLIDLKQLPHLEPHPHSLMRHITAVEAAGQPAVTFLRVERVGRILEVLRSTAHNGFVVISGAADCEQHIMGIVLRSQLVVLLRTRRCFQPTPFVSEVGAGAHRCCC